MKQGGFSYFLTNRHFHFRTMLHSGENLAKSSHTLWPPDIQRRRRFWKLFVSHQQMSFLEKIGIVTIVL